MKYKNVNIINNLKVSNEFYELSFYWDEDVKPGQFFMIKPAICDIFLKRPISVYNYKDGIVSMLYRISGKGTAILAKLKQDDELNVLGPLGNGFNTEYKGKNIALVCGGIGIAPMVYLAESLRSNNNIDIYVGFKDEVFIPDSFKDFKDKIYIATESGKEGFRGFVTDIFDPQYDIVYACGPDIMMKKVASMCKENNIKCFVSLESHMACGLGACLTCVCDTKYGKKRVCREGPVFNGDELWI